MILLSSTPDHLDITFASPAGDLSQLMTTTRASPALTYAPTSTGSLTSFAANVPRITDLGLLVEESRTNLATYSQDITQHQPWNYGWNGTDSTITGNFYAAPDGTLTAGKVVTNANNEGIFQRSTTLPSANQTYTASIWVYSATGFTGSFGIADTPNATAWVSNPVQVIVIPAGVWTRVSLSATAKASVTATSVTFDVLANTSGTTFSVWGLNYELGSFPTSYIPTTSAAVTRDADVITTLGAFNAALGNNVSIIATAKCLDPSPDINAVITTRVVAEGSCVLLRVDAGPHGTAGWNAASLGSLGTWNIFASNTIGLTANNSGGFSGCLNGGTVLTSLTSDYTGHATDALIGSEGIGADGDYFNGFIQRIAVWDSRLSDAALQQLTS